MSASPITDNHFGDATGGDRVGLGEVRFTLAPAVTNTNDSGAGSLRQALVDVAAGGTITFAAGLSGQTIALLSQLVPAKNVIIDATALPAGITLTGGSGVRHFQINAGISATLRGLTLTGGSLAGTDGGAILNNSGTLALERCTLHGNSARFGGALSNGGTGTASFTRCTLAGNTASDSGGAIDQSGGAVTLTHCTVSGNFANVSGSKFGGGIFVGISKSLTLANSVVGGNTATSGADIYLNNSAALARQGADIIQALTTTTGNAITGPAALTSAPNLAPFGNYGGIAKTRPPFPGSPALDIADTTIAARAATDERGSPRGSAVWANDFALNLNGATARGVAVIESGNLRLTPNVASQYGTLVLPDLGAMTSFTAAFDFLFSATPSPADGVSFSFGPTSAAWSASRASIPATR